MYDLQFRARISRKRGTRSAVHKIALSYILSNGKMKVRDGKIQLALSRCRFQTKKRAELLLSLALFVFHPLKTSSWVAVIVVHAVIAARQQQQHQPQQIILTVAFITLGDYTHAIFNSYMHELYVHIFTGTSKSIMCGKTHYLSARRWHQLLLLPFTSYAIMSIYNTISLSISRISMAGV